MPPRNRWSVARKQGPETERRSRPTFASSRRLVPERASQARINVTTREAEAGPASLPARRAHLPAGPLQRGSSGAAMPPHVIRQLDDELRFIFRKRLGQALQICGRRVLAQVVEQRKRQRNNPTEVVGRRSFQRPAILQALGNRNADDEKDCTC